LVSPLLPPVYANARDSPLLFRRFAGLHRTATGFARTTHHLTSSFHRTAGRYSVHGLHTHCAATRSGHSHIPGVLYLLRSTPSFRGGSSHAVRCVLPSCLFSHRSLWFVLRFTTHLCGLFGLPHVYHWISFYVYIFFVPPVCLVPHGSTLFVCIYTATVYSFPYVALRLHCGCAPTPHSRTYRTRHVPRHVLPYAVVYGCRLRTPPHTGRHTRTPRLHIALHLRFLVVHLHTISHTRFTLPSIYHTLHTVVWLHSSLHAHTPRAGTSLRFLVLRSFSDVCRTVRLRSLYTAAGSSHLASSCTPPRAFWVTADTPLHSRFAFTTGLLTKVWCSPFCCSFWRMVRFPSTTLSGCRAARAHTILCLPLLHTAFLSRILHVSRLPYTHYAHTPGCVNFPLPGWTTPSCYLPVYWLDLIHTHTQFSFAFTGFVSRTVLWTIRTHASLPFTCMTLLRTPPVAISLPRVRFPCCLCRPRFTVARFACIFCLCTHAGSCIFAAHAFTHRRAYCAIAVLPVYARSSRGTRIRLVYHTRILPRTGSSRCYALRVYHHLPLYCGLPLHLVDLPGFVGLFHFGPSRGCAFAVLVFFTST